MAIWMRIELDQYELPTAVAGSVSELARICGVTTDTIYSARFHAKEHGHRCRYLKVEEIDEEEN